MEKELKKVARVVISGTPYLVFRDTDVEGMPRENGTFNHIIRRLLLTDLGGTWVGAINFVEDIKTAFTFKNDGGALYGFSETLEFAYANLLPHLPIEMKTVTSIFADGQKCFDIFFDSVSDGFSKDGFTYNVELRDSFLKTGQRIVFRNGMSKKAIKREILQILSNALEENPGTNLRIEDLQSSVPLTIKDITFNLQLLRDEGKVDLLTQLSETKPIVSAKITAKGFSDLETEDETINQLPAAITNNYGTNFVNQTYGSNSPIIVNIDKISNAFNEIREQIEKNPEIQNKDEVLKLVDEVKKEVVNKNNPSKTKQILDNLKKSSEWVYSNVINNPYVSGIIVDLLMKAATH